MRECETCMVCTEHHSHKAIAAGLGMHVGHDTFSLLVSNGEITANTHVHSEASAYLHLNNTARGQSMYMQGTPRTTTHLGGCSCSFKRPGVWLSHGHRSRVNQSLAAFLSEKVYTTTSPCAWVFDEEISGRSE